jgi:aryl-alcohol dehydrogenase-like predicted oxidoreductase
MIVNNWVEGKGLNGFEEKDTKIAFEKIDALKPIAEAIGCTLAQLALAWVLFFLYTTDLISIVY